MERGVTDDALVRIRRPDGSTALLRVPGEHLQRVMDLACGEFGDPSIVMGDIPPPRMHLIDQQNPELSKRGSKLRAKA